MEYTQDENELLEDNWLEDDDRVEDDNEELGE